MTIDRNTPIPAAPHHKEADRPDIKLPELDFRPVICERRSCKGFRHPIGNCVICGEGPAPGAVNWFGEPMPNTELEKQIVIWKLFKGIEPPTLNGRHYPTPNQLAEFKIPDNVDTAWDRMVQTLTRN